MTTDMLIACNPRLSDVMRLEAWRRDEAEFWFRSHTERGLPFDALPVDYVDRVRQKLIAREIKGNLSEN